MNNQRLTRGIPGDTLLPYTLTTDPASLELVENSSADSSEEFNINPDTTAHSTHSSDDANGTSSSSSESSARAGYTTPIYLPYDNAQGNDTQNDYNGSIDNSRVADQYLGESTEHTGEHTESMQDNLFSHTENNELIELQLPSTDVHMPPADSATNNLWSDNESTSINIIAELQLDAIENDDDNSNNDIEMDDNEYLAASESEAEAEYDTEMDEDEEMRQFAMPVHDLPALTIVPMNIEDNDEANISESVPLAPAVVPILTSSSESSSGDMLTTPSPPKSKRLPYTINSSPTLSPPMLSSPTISPEFSRHASSAIQVMQQAMQAMDTASATPKRKAIA
ncbi:hypothetical protein COEREDRAFT_12023 [Coemansia reversa NRRL 1564]|uniref:Uncharacterized protein n=1 Tax=Coemansia reversa (strain ATCC 12441 / NRRL 1564) TaxID=763665 RepID=A0A2G5B1K0_COERN|nr:hypothetical protein COEREDRAFT_12023 [Coemansia reversa NRRL 1564]|eukprot:PIA12889.1 hypothetical protein COEREDRAFT_12023 [Coemansia reversa NRRL 1564]